MPCINFLGVILHEACLTTMIISANPFVAVSPILADAIENIFCLWSLHHAVTSFEQKRSSKVSPIMPSVSEMMNIGVHDKKSLSKRSSNLMSLIWDLNNNTSLVGEDDANRMSLFIAATLLQRELVELVVPIQAALVLSILYYVDLGSNSLVSGWNLQDYTRAMTYLSIDVVVEIAMFTLTIFLLKRIQPEFSAFRILMGLVRTNLTIMILITYVAWHCTLMFQSTLTGVDMTLKFQWLHCGDNSTWLGGFDWDEC